MRNNNTFRNAFLLGAILGQFFANFLPSLSHADTPPPGSVKAKLHSGDGLTQITATGTAIDTKVISSSIDPVLASIIFGGSVIDPRNIRALTPADTLSCQQSGVWNVNVSGGSITIPGVATEATLATVAKETGGNLESIADDTALVKTAVQSLDTKVTAVNTNAVTVTSSVLPTGAATQATLATRASEATLATRASEASMAAAAASVASIDSKITTTIDGIRVDVGGATFTANSDLNDGAGNPITSTVDGPKRRLDVQVQSPLAIEGGNASAVVVDGSAVTQPISAAALPLPSGAATETTLSALNTKVTTTANGVKVDGSAVTQPISVSTLPLPTGAATEATLASRAAESTQQTVRDRVTDINNKLNTLGQKTMTGSVPVTMASDQGPIAVNGTVAVTGVATEATLSSLNAKVRAYDVDTSGVTENVQGVSIRLPGASGSTPGGTATNPLRVDPTGTTTQPVNVVGGMISLPAGSATEAKQDVGNASLANIDADIDTTLSSRATEATLGTLNGKVPTGLTVNVNKLLVDGSGVTQPISAASLPLPTGAATSAMQTTGNGFLSSIDGKITAVNTNNVTVTSSALPTGAATEATLATRGSEATLSTRASESTLSTLNGKVYSLDLDTGAGVQTAQGVNLRFSENGGSVEAGTASSPLRMDPTGTTTQPVNVTTSVLPTGAATEATLSSLNGKVTTVDTGNVTVVSSALPTGAATSANQVTANASLSSIDGKIIKSDTDDVTVTASALPTGASTEAKQDVGNASLSSIDTDVDVALSTRASESTLSSLNGKFNSLGQKTMANSAPVVIASDQSAIPSSQSGTWSVRAQDGAGNNLTSTVVSSSRALDSNVVRTVNNQDQSTSGTVAALNATVVGSSNGGGSFVFALSGTWSATAVLEGSIDGANWTTINFAPVGGGLAVTSTTSNGVFRALSPGGFSQLRVRASAYSSGTMNVVMNSGSGSNSTLANQLNAANLQTQMNASNGGSPIQVAADASGNLSVVGNVASGASDSGNPVKVGARFNSTLPTVTNGQRVDLQTNSFGELAVSFRNRSFRQAGATTGTQIKTGIGRVHQICSTVYNGAGTLNIYDNTSATGTQIFSLVQSNNNAAQSMCTGPLGIEFSTGLYLVTTGANQIWYVVYQ